MSEVVARQRDAGISLLGDGEYGKAMTHDVDYRAWRSYSFQRVSGLALTEASDLDAAPQTSSTLQVGSFQERRDRKLFPGAYADPLSGITTGVAASAFPTTVGPIRYTGGAAVADDVRRLRQALQPGEEGFLTAISPGSAARIRDLHYANDQEHLWAWADALREEYTAILDAGLHLQIDDPSLAENWDLIHPEPSVRDYQEFTRLRVAALNHAIEGLPRERIRLHLCWGSWHGPHVTDIPLADIVDVILEANVGSISFEAANARHEHEWTVWQQATLPDDLVLIPGVIGHATNVVEHPELVAQRIEKFASIVGPERVVASTDCGLGGRVHPEIAWAKLAALGEGARIASTRV